MKTKSFHKKLSLNKNTVVNLDNNDMDKLKGGETTLTCGACGTLVSCYPTHCKTCMTLCDDCFTQAPPC